MNDTPPERLALSREFSEFLVELSVALHKYGMYPSGHPSLEPAAAAVVSRAARLLDDRAQIAFGIARRQLIIEGVATNAAQPVLRRLAEGLHRHHLGAVSIGRGLTVHETSEALAALAREPEQHGAVGLVPVGDRPIWPHLRLHPLSFAGLAIADTGPPTPGDGGAMRSAELWVGLARAAMAGEAAGPSTEPPSTEPSLVARAIDQHPREEAYDQVIIGYLLQIARELKTSGGADAGALQRRTARLVGALRPETLRRLVEMGGDAAQRRAFVLDATHGMAVDAVIDIVKAAADASGQTISHGLSRMLSKLAAHAEFGEAPVRPAADVALREQVGRLLSGWELADPNPAGYSSFLQHLATTSRDRPADSASDASLVDPLRLVEIGLEVGGAGPMIDRSIDRAIRDGHTADLLARLASPPEHSHAGAVAVTAHLVRPDVLAILLQQSPIDFDSLDRLLPAMGRDGFDVLLEVLATAEHRTTRRKLLDRLAAAPVDLSASIVARLADDRWFVQRNMLVLLARLSRLPDGLSLARWSAHPDVRVRHEAIRLQLTIPAERTAAVRAALEDGHPRLVHSGLAAIRHDCPGSVAGLVGAIAGNPAVTEELRVLAARALGHCRDPRGLSQLVALVDGGRTLLGRPRLALRTPVLTAALEAMATGWRGDDRALLWFRLAAESADPDIRRAVEARLS